MLEVASSSHGHISVQVLQARCGKECRCPSGVREEKTLALISGKVAKRNHRFKHEGVRIFYRNVSIQIREPMSTRSFTLYSRACSRNSRCFRNQFRRCSARRSRICTHTYTHCIIESLNADCAIKNWVKELTTHELCVFLTTSPQVVVCAGK